MSAQHGIGLVLELIFIARNPSAVPTIRLRRFELELCKYEHQLVTNSANLLDIREMCSRKKIFLGTAGQQSNYS